MIPSWLTIGIAATLIAVGVLKLNTSKGINWFNRQKRPAWLTFEGLIPFIWMTIFICGAWSAYATWSAQPGSLRSWLLMGGYGTVEVLIMLYNPAMAWFRSLAVGVWVGAIGFGCGAILAFFVFPQSFWGGILLLPYLLWSPVGTYVTWVMDKINNPMI
jgi:translocator protein